MKKYLVSFSGGKDSTAMLLRLLEEGRQVDDIIYCDTGLEFPEMKSHIDKVQHYIRREITVLKPEKDYMYWATEHERTIRTAKVAGISTGDIVRGYGYPALRSRWCTAQLKTNVINRYIADLRNKGVEIVQYIGIAADEPKRIRGENYPLVEWCMTEADCLKYCYDRGFNWGGLYEIWDRVSCWCCPLQSLSDLRKLRKYRPELWERLKEMDRLINEKCVSRKDFRFRCSLADIERRLELEDEYITRGEKVRSKKFFEELSNRGINYRL